MGAAVFGSLVLVGCSTIFHFQCFNVDMHLKKMYREFMLTLMEALTERVKLLDVRL